MSSKQPITERKNFCQKLYKVKIYVVFQGLFQTDNLEHKRQLMALQEATADPAPDKISLMEKVSILREETKKYEEMKMEEAKDHSLIAFRQNANNLARRKEAQAEILQEKRQEEEELRQEVEEKKKVMEQEFGGAPMNDQQLKGIVCFYFMGTALTTRF